MKIVTLQSVPAARLKIVAKDRLKTKSSYRTLPLIPYIESVLREEAERQEEMRKIMRGSYNKAYSEHDLK